MSSYHMQNPLAAPSTVRPDILTELPVPGGLGFALHEGAMPQWLRAMPWSASTVSCGDRLFRNPEPDGFSLVITDATGGIGYLSASLTDSEPGKAQLWIEMIQVSADHRREGVGTALAAGLAEIICREFDAHVARGLYPPVIEIQADSEGAGSQRIVERLGACLDAAHELACDRVDEQAAAPSVS